MGSKCFFQYSEYCFASTEQRPRVFSRNVKSLMFISHQIYEEYKITINQIIEAVKFLF